MADEPTVEAGGGWESEDIRDVLQVEEKAVRVIWPHRFTTLSPAGNISETTMIYHCSERSCVKPVGRHEEGTLGFPRVAGKSAARPNLGFLSYGCNLPIVYPFPPEGMNNNEQPTATICLAM